ncbi:MAG: hotdog fold domain-containing protein [Gammaproteobacteria bacterium]
MSEHEPVSPSRGQHPVATLFARMKRWPLGAWLFSRAVSFKAPYFSSIAGRFIELVPGRAVVRVRKRRSVTNHIGTVHAIAMANACELAAGTLTVITIPRSMRWIPKGMTIRYERKATTSVTATATIDHVFDEQVAVDLVVPVSVTDEAGQVVVTADITMYVTPKP